MNRVSLSIAGRNYTLQTTDEPAYAENLAKDLEQKIRDLMHQNLSLSVSDACILVSLELLDQYQKESIANDNLRSEIQDYISRMKEADNAQAELRKKLAFYEAEKKSRTVK